MSGEIGGKLRDAGYEALFHLGGFVALSLHPTQRNLNEIVEWIHESQGRRQLIRHLETRGLVRSGEPGGGWVPVLTDRGRALFAGGRDPNTAWGRPWDGEWRLLTFDLPRQENQSRMKLRNWLCRNHFGRLQGSVWMSPDPVTGIEELLAAGRIDPRQVMVFEGLPIGKQPPRELAATAWNFERIDAGYERYASHAKRSMGILRKPRPSQARLQKLLREDRQLWIEAVRRDPLLPQALHPKGYRGPAAWDLHGEVLSKLAKVLDLPPA